MSDQTLANLSFFPLRAFPSVFLFCPPPRPVILLLSLIFPRLFRSLLSVKRALLLPSARVSLPSQFAIRRGGAMREESQKTKTAISPLFFLRQTAAKGGKKAWHKSLYPTLVGDRPQVRQKKVR